jgi:hypothetical protein
VSQQYMLRPSVVLKTLKSAVHAVAFSSLFIIGLDYWALCVFAVFILQSAVKLVTQKKAAVRLTLSEKECLVDGKPINIQSEYFDTPWLLVLRYRWLEPDKHAPQPKTPAYFRRARQSVLIVLPDTMSIGRRRALSRQLRWQCFS